MLQEASTLEQTPSSPAEVAEPTVVLPERYQHSLERTQQITASVGPELKAHAVESVNNIPPEPGVYIFNGHIDPERYSEIIAAKFDLDAKTLSGKVDSAHAVLPGMLGLIYRNKDGVMAEKHMNVAAKGFYNRTFQDRVERVTSEVRDSYQQDILGELAFHPIAVVVAPPEYVGEHKDYKEYDLVLITALDESATTLDNAPWQLGFSEGNLELAEAAVNALGRFNTHVGRHGDAKVKNIAQHPDGQTSMIDFETGGGIDWQSPADVADAIHEDLGKLFSSFDELGFFKKDSHQASEVLNKLGQAYMENWKYAEPAIQEAALDVVVNLIDQHQAAKR